MTIILLLVIVWTVADISAKRRHGRLGSSWQKITGVPLSIAPDQTASPSMMEIERHASRIGLAFIDRSVVSFDPARRKALQDWLQARFAEESIPVELDGALRADVNRLGREFQLLAQEAAKGDDLTLPRSARDPLDPRLPNFLHYMTLIRYLIAASEIGFESGRTAEAEASLVAASRLIDATARYPEVLGVLLAIALDHDVATVAIRWSTDRSWAERLRRRGLAKSLWLAQEYQDAELLEQVAKTGFTEDPQNSVGQLFWLSLRPATEAWMLRGAEETVLRISSPPFDRCGTDTRPTRIPGHPMWSRVDLINVDSWHRKLALREFRVEGVTVVASPSDRPLRHTSSICPRIEWRYDGTLLTPSPLPPDDPRSRPWSVHVKVSR